MNNNWSGKEVVEFLRSLCDFELPALLRGDESHQVIEHVTSVIFVPSRQFTIRHKLLHLPFAPRMSWMYLLASIRLDSDTVTTLVLLSGQRSFDMSDILC